MLRTDPNFCEQDRNHRESKAPMFDEHGEYPSSVRPEIKELVTPSRLAQHTLPSVPFIVNPPPTMAEPSASCEQTRWFTEEVQPHETSLRSYLKGSFSTVRDVDDIVQESYLRLLKARTAHPIECARAFLFRVARNVAINLLNRERVSPIDAVKDIDSLLVVEDGLNAAASACAREELLLLAQAIDSLPARCREIVILRRIKNVSQKEIAARLGIAEATVEVQVVRGVKRCGDYLRRHGVRFEL